MADPPLPSVITVRGKELAADATVGDARTLFASSSVQLIPVLDGTAYLGAGLRADIDGAGDDEPITGFAQASPPTATASTPAGEALPAVRSDRGRGALRVGGGGAPHI